MKLIKILLISLMLTLPVFAAEKVTVFGAASTTDMMNELMSIYNKKGGNAIASYASSGVLARQIESGAPADIFISANQEWMDYLADKNLVAAGTRTDWLGNTIVLVAPKGSKVSYKIAKNASIAKLLKKGERLAIGDPEHVPAGSYARQAMKNLGIWDDVEKNIAAAENVRSVLMLVSRSEVPLGIVFGSDYVAGKDSVDLVDTFPADSHELISYPMGIVKGHDNAEVKKFYAFLKSDEAKPVIEKYGFTLVK